MSQCVIVRVYTHPAKSGQLIQCSDLSTDWMIRESGIDLQREQRFVSSLHLANRLLSNPHCAVSPNVCSRPLTSIYWPRFSNGGVILPLPLRLAVFRLTDNCTCYSISAILFFDATEINKNPGLCYGAFVSSEDLLTTT